MVKLLKVVNEDVIFEIYDMNPETGKMLAFTCRYLSKLLFYRHVVFKKFPHLTKLEFLRNKNTNHLGIYGSIRENIYPGIKIIRTLPVLQHISMKLISASVDDKIKHKILKELTTLGTISSVLVTLKLDLDGIYIGDVGAQTLALFNESKTIQTLELNLTHNRIGDFGAQALSMLKNSISIKRLTLFLCWNHIGDVGAQALSLLKDSKSIKTLNLDLSMNDFKFKGQQALKLLVMKSTLTKVQVINKDFTEDLPFQNDCTPLMPIIMNVDGMQSSNLKINLDILPV